ncbi:hypothetical protein LF1_31120 [Rubripirellula obstinata]|uniref:YbjN domain-containing protein n=1 Tax=Rubripirellula obstinata TaxID=406547 RepID=A0A5B1CJW3_9BACT|nr:YbjN domain-containing protein [Rubripirellula obstinata]KAA1260572.1 hypothetical protein LF1_31120 [Rubripirellula obstinata]
MAVNQFRIEAFFEEEELRYFRAGEDAESGSWFLMFGSKTGVNVRLLEDGECILIRSQPLVHLDEFSREGRCRVWEAMAHRNDQMVVGRYSGTENVVVEAALPIEDGEISDNQLKRMLAVVVNESNHYGPHLRQIAHDETVKVREDPIDGLMRQLLEGSELEDDDAAPVELGPEPFLDSDESSGDDDENEEQIQSKLRNESDGDDRQDDSSD